MANYFERKDRFNNDREKYYNTKPNKRLKYAAIGVITIAIILLAISALCIDSISYNMLMILRGCAGLFTLFFVILVAILLYRVNVAYFADKNKPKH